MPTIETITTEYNSEQVECVHIVADEPCRWRFHGIIDIKSAYAFQFIGKADSKKNIYVSINGLEYPYYTLELNTEFKSSGCIFPEEYVTVTGTSLDIDMPKGEFWFINTMLEYGDEPTEFSDATMLLLNKTQTISLIEQNTSSILLQVSEEVQDGVSESKSYTDSQVELTKNQIVLKVDSNGNMVEVKLGVSADDESATEFKVNADNIELTASDVFNIVSGGTLNLTADNVAITSDNFSVDSNGNVIANSIAVNSGTIGGFVVSNSANTGVSSNGGHVFAQSLYVHSSDSTYEYEAGLRGSTSSSTTYIMYVRSINAGDSWSNSSNLFSVSNDGSLYCTKGTIASWIADTDSLYSRTEVQSGVAGTQYEIGLYAPTDATNTTNAIRGRARTYDGSSFGSFNTVFYIRYDGRIMCGTVDGDGYIRSGSSSSTDTQQIFVQNDSGYLQMRATAGASSDKGIYATNANGVSCNVAYATQARQIYVGSGIQGTSHTLGATFLWCSGSDANGTNSGYYRVGAYAGSVGHWYGCVPVITSDGVMEVGKYIDFHTASETSGSESDYTFRLNNSADGSLVASGSITQNSSRKIKENISEISDDEAVKILGLKPVRFDYIKGAKNKRGFIAEDVQDILPNLVIPEEGDVFTHDWLPASLDYIGIIPYLVKLIQKQQKQIDKLMK